MHLLSFLILNNITQIRVSDALHYNFESFKYTNNKGTTLFYGLYNIKDYEYFNKHTGKKWILWCGNDIDISNKARLKLIQSLKNVEDHLYYDNKLTSNLEFLKFNFKKVSLNKINLSNFLNYINYDTFSDINFSFYSESKEIICLLSKYNNIKLKKIENSDIIISFNNDSFSNKNNFLNKLHFTNINDCKNPNQVYYKNYKELIIKLYYFILNLKQCEKILSENDLEKNRSNTVTFIPVWKRHELLIESINSVKYQTEECKLLAICSSNEDYEFIKSLNIDCILTINLPLGKKYQLGFEFSKLYYPKNVIILGSDDILSKNYIENINKYINKYDIVGLRNWKINEIHENKIYELEYCHKIKNYNNKLFWGSKNVNISKIFNSEIEGFSANLLKEFPFSIGAGRSIGYNILNKIKWQLYPNAKKMLDTLSLYNLLILNKATYKTIKSSNFYITSLKDTNIDMITPKEKYLNSEHIIVTELN